ncbi:MAG: glycoside hydrolase family 71/99-like protein [Bacteroidales bacterium]
MKLPILTYLLLLIATFVTAQPAGVSNSLRGKVICGYQGWFNCYGDGSPVNAWRHWSPGSLRTPDKKPAKGSLTFEAWPDVSECPRECLYPTAFAQLGNGKPSLLFSSVYQKVTDLHFSWMQHYGIDGIALQRFLGETKTAVYRQQRDSIAVHIMKASEKYGRIFYLMYDMSANDTAFFQHDLLHIENDLPVFSSPNYVHENGKPVICLWGFGFNHRPDEPQKSLAIIRWLHDKGYYVIGGVPTNWRTGSIDSYADYESVYKAFDMLSPWSVGRFKTQAEADTFHQNYLEPDMEWCKAHHKDYQPVAFPGFAWSNWNGGMPNMITRDKGNFMWRQIANIKASGSQYLYIAMFDEYDEGTAIAKMADSYLAIPADQYFLTSSADGTYVSSDFYLRLVGKAARVMKGEIALSDQHGVSLQSSPVWLRTSFESGYDALPLVIDVNGSYSLSKEKAASGSQSLKISGPAALKYPLFEVNIPVTSTTCLTYQLFPVNKQAQGVFVQLITTDGEQLKAKYPGKLKLNNWNTITFNMGKIANGKTIAQIVITPATTNGTYTLYLDDLLITDNGTGSF